MRIGYAPVDRQYEPGQIGRPARNSRPDGVEDAGYARPPTRIWHRTAHSANLAGRAPSEPGHALPGVVAAGTKRLDHVRVGDFGQQPPRQVLLAHPVWAQATGGADRELGAHVGDHRASARSSALGGTVKRFLSL